MTLKCDFHIHTSEDQKDSVAHSAKELILFAAEKGFNAIAITNHDTFTYNNELKNIAADNGIVLIPGIEKNVEKKHVLMLNAFPATEKIDSFEDLRKAREDGLFVIAPHPFFKMRCCLEKKLVEHLELFDAIEFSFFYSKWFNFNRQATKLADERGIPLVGNSDCHILKYLGVCHSLIQVQNPSKEAIFSTILDKNVEIVSKPIFLPKLFAILAQSTAHKRYLRRLEQSIRVAIPPDNEAQEVVA